MSAIVSPRADAALAQAGRDGYGLVPQPAVADRLLGSRGAFAAQVHVHALGLELGVPPERLDERPDVAADGAGGSDGGGILARRQPQRLVGRGVEDRARESRGSVDREAAVVERPAEGALEPCQELDALEAAEADLALERGRGGHCALGVRAAGLAGELAHHVEDARDDFLGSRRRRGGRVTKAGHRRSLYTDKRKGRGTRPRPSLRQKVA